MNTHESKNKNFIIMILFMVFMVSGAKTLHDITTSESDQTPTELMAEKEVAIKE